MAGERGKERPSQSVGLSSSPTPCPTCMPQVAYLSEHPSPPWLPLGLDRPILIPASISGCGSPSFCLCTPVVASCNSMLLGYFSLPYLALSFFITWVTSSLHQNNLLCSCKYLKWFLFFGLNTSRTPCQAMSRFM